MSAVGIRYMVIQSCRECTLTLWPWLHAQQWPREQTAIECRVRYLEVVSIQYALALVLISDTVPVCTNMGWEISGLRSADKYRSYKFIRKTRKKLICLCWLIDLMHLIKCIKCDLSRFKSQIKQKWLGISYVSGWIWLIFDLFVLIRQ
jgi:hypothetical protein